MLQVQHLTKSYKTGTQLYPVLKDISFEVKKGEFVAGMGPSGSGKTTLLNCMTALEPGSNWNTMPSHTHERRMEIYTYFEIPEGQAVFHMCGEPTETRHVVMHNYDAVISPSWSIHSGVGTSNYTFIWAMGGENMEFDDMDNIATTDLR